MSNLIGMCIIHLFTKKRKKKNMRGHIIMSHCFSKLRDEKERRKKIIHVFPHTYQGIYKRNFVCILITQIRMATSRTSIDESLVERDEVLFPNTDVIDTEPHYNNFTTIQNALRHREEEKQMNNVSFITHF